MEMVNVVIMGVLGMALLVAAVGVLKLMFNVLSSKSDRSMLNNKPSSRGNAFPNGMVGLEADKLGLPTGYDPSINFGGGMRGEDD